MSNCPTEDSPVPTSQPIPSFIDILGHFANLIRIGNQTGTILLLLPTLWALVLASNGWPDPSFLAIFTLGAFLMRSVGVIMNDLADRYIDRKVSRTQRRPLASGAISIKQALFVGAILSLFAASLLFFLPPLAIVMSPVAVLLAAIYPFTKRRFHLPQLVLGIAFGWGVVMAWVTIRNQMELPMWLLFAATVCWATAYDTIYALQDRVDDLRIGVRSSAILFGSYTWLGVGVASGGMMVCLGLTGWQMELGLVFFGVLMATSGFLSQQVLKLRHEVSPAQSFSMFKQHVWVGVAILMGIGLGTL